MKKLYIYLSLVFAVALNLANIALYAANDTLPINYSTRYDRGYWGDDYSQRISFLNGYEQNRGGIPY